MDQSIDRLSDLPDEILSHILSVLPIKVACTTTILSKQWISLFHSLTSLHFEEDDDKALLQSARFRHFVDTLMLSHHHPIKSFRLTCRSKLSGVDVAPLDADEWVEAAKRRRVEDFQICISDQLTFPERRRLQDALFSYMHLEPQRRRNHEHKDEVVSAIQDAKRGWAKRIRLAENLKLPPGILTCKTLVVLKLTGVIVGPSVYSVDLPSLKTLHLMEVFFHTRKIFRTLLSGCPVLEDLHASTVNHLQRLRQDEYYNVSELRNLLNLVKAYIRGLHVPLTVLHNVRFLHIDWKDYLISTHRIPLFIGNFNRAVPVFQNLLHLELCYLPSSEVLRFLQHCPKLQILVTKKCFGRHDCPESPPPPPECTSLHHLKTCYIIDYGGPYDLQFASYILKNASLLQGMTIVNSKYQDPEQMFQDLENFQLWSPSVHPACKISLTSSIEFVNY